MDSKQLVAEYRLAHWMQIIQDRQDSGLNIKDYSSRIGIHHNTYFYWQRKVRIAACNHIAGNSDETSTQLAPGRFTEVRVVETVEPEAHGLIRLELHGIQISADSGYPTGKLIEVIKGLASL